MIRKALAALGSEVRVVSATIGLLFIGALFIVVSFAMRGSGFTRNRAIGIRTKATLDSDEAWASGHNAAAPWVLSAGIFSSGMGLGALSLTVAVGQNEVALDIAPFFVTLAFGLVIILILVATAVANRAARRGAARSGSSQSKGES